ncbi:MAG: hypothetical protein HKO06_06255 [Pseudomonadales bacterium]|nr:hypothetical protein [Pseudomonadales bacterium]
MYLCSSLLFVFSGLASAAADKQNGRLFKEVQDLDYGVAIYDYFQQDYFGALSELLIAEKKGSIRHHTDFAKVLRGGIHLSYGMDDEAKHIFYEIIQDGRNQDARKSSAGKQLMGASRRASDENIARAWFYLGKLLYKKGHFIDAGENLEHVEKNLSGDLHPEFAFLMDAVSQRIRSTASDFDYLPDSLPVASFEPDVPAGSSWSYYQRFNELLERILQHEAVVKGTEEEQVLNEYYPVNDGVTDDLLTAEAPDEELEQELHSVVSAPVPEDEELAAMPLKKKLRHNARVARALEHLAAKVGASRTLHEAEELMSLKDKIHTTAGFLYLHLAREKRAVRNFKQVRNDSVLVGQALLGYGWAATNNGDFKAALKPLQVLASRPMLEQTTHEAHLALPFVYEKMEAHTAALEGYDRAATVMQQELQLLDSLSEDLESVDPAELHKYYDRESVRWLESSRSQSAEVKKQLFVTRVLKNRLLRLMTQNHFSLMENQRQDIAWLQKKLQQWSMDLETMRFVIEARQQHSREAISEQSRGAIQARALALQARRETLMKRLDSIHANKDKTARLVALATPEQQELAEKLDAARARVTEITELTEKVQGKVTDKQLQAIFKPLNFEQNKRLLAFAEGTQLWSLSAQENSRQWQVEKTLTKVDRALVEANSSIASLDKLVAEAERQELEYARLTRLQTEVVASSETANALAGNLNRKILAMLLEDVGRMKQQTTVYLAQARLARARMLDNLSYEDFEVLSDADSEQALPDAEQPLRRPLSMQGEAH